VIYLGQVRALVIFEAHFREQTLTFLICRRKRVEIELLEERLTEVGAQATREEVSEIVSAMDVQGDGTISRDEFELMMESLDAIAQENGSQGWPQGHCMFGKLGHAMTWREIIWFSLEDPKFSKLAHVMSAFIIFVIVASSLVVVVEAQPGMSESAVIYSAEASSVAIFTAEFCLRLLCAPDYCKFFSGFLNYVDFIAILPFYLELIL